MDQSTGAGQTTVDLYCKGIRREVHGLAYWRTRSAEDGRHLVKFVAAALKVMPKCNRRMAQPWATIDRARCRPLAGATLPRSAANRAAASAAATGSINRLYNRSLRPKGRKAAVPAHGTQAPCGRVAWPRLPPPPGLVHRAVPASPAGKRMGLTQIAVFLAATVIAVPLFRRFRLSAVLAYLAAASDRALRPRPRSTTWRASCTSPSSAWCCCCSSSASSCSRPGCWRCAGWCSGWAPRRWWSRPRCWRRRAARSG